MRVAFQGELGAFSELAITHLFNGAATSVTPVPCREFTDVVNAVVTGAVDAGVLPLSNTTIGPIAAAQLALDAAAATLVVTQETLVPIHPLLLACEGATLADIREVTSHPAALAQCAAYLARHPAWRILATYDTAGAARDLAAAPSRTRAVIAAPAASHRYQLITLAADIADRPDNATRFVLIEPLPTRS